MTAKRYPSPRAGSHVGVLRRAAATSPTDPLLATGTLVVDEARGAFWLEPEEREGDAMLGGPAR